jgi:hypothetical protein
MTTVYSVRPHLKQGSNLIAVEVVNLMSPGAVNLDVLAVNKGNGKDKFQRFGSNESWRTFDKAAEGWTQLDFNDAAWRRAALRGQATPGSFCRLPYRFMGTAGTVKLSGVAFPKEISTDRQYRLTAEVALNAEDGYPGVTGGAALFFQLINSSNNVVSKFHKFVITGEMLKKQRITLDIPFNPLFLRKDDYKLRIYADRLALSEAPAGFTLNREGNYLEMPVRVINERKVEISDARLVGHDGVARFVINGKEYPAFRFQHGAHTQFVTEESLDIADRVHSSATPVIDIQLGRSAWFYNADGTCNFDASHLHPSHGCCFLQELL